MLLRKLLCHSYVKISSQELRDTLTTVFWRTPCGWKFYGHRSRYVLIFHQEFSKQHETKINKGTLNIITREENANPHFKEHYTKIVISLVVIRLFFSQTNLVFKSNPLFIDILDSFCHSLFTFLPFDFYLYSTDFEVYSMPLRLFYKNQ